MQKLNCWQIKNCGREIGGKAVAGLGVCPAATAEHCDGINHGNNAGRYCWRVAGTMIDGEAEGIFASKIKTCGNCEVFHRIIREEGTRFAL